MCMPNVELKSPFTIRKEEGVGHNCMAPNTGVRYVCIPLVTPLSHVSQNCMDMSVCIYENLLCCA